MESNEERSKMGKLSKQIFSFEDEQDKLLFEAEKLQLDLVAQINETLEIKGWSKKDFAEKIGVSQSFVTQLFSADKFFSFKLLAVIQAVLGVKFVFKIKQQEIDLTISAK